MSYLDEVVYQVTAWDNARQRSQQTALGWSQVAGCRAYMGFRMAGEWSTDDTDNWRAIAGTALHAWLQKVRDPVERASEAWLFAHEGDAEWEAYLALHKAREDGTASIDFEVGTSYQGIPGHADEVDWEAGEVTDYKFPSLRSAALWDDPKVLDEKFIQVQGYAAGLSVDHERQTGMPAEFRVRLLVAPVDGTFSDWRVYERPFDRDVADAAVARYREAEAMYQAGQELPRDKPAWWCVRFCEFSTLCRPGLTEDHGEDLPVIEDEELAAAVERYGLAKEQGSEADAVKKQLGPLIRGLRGTARGWRITTSAPGYDWKTDKEQIEADYAASGLEVPMRQYPKKGALNVTRVKPDQGES